MIVLYASVIVLGTVHGSVRTGALVNTAIVLAILCSFSFEVFVRISTEDQALRHASFIVATAHIAIQLV